MWKAKIALALFFALISISANAADNLDNLQQILESLQRLQDAFPLGPVGHATYQTPSTSESIFCAQPSTLMEKSGRRFRRGTNRLVQSVLNSDKPPFIQRFFEHSRQGDASAGTQRPCKSAPKSGLSPLEISTARLKVASLVNDLMLPYYRALQFSLKQENSLKDGAKLPHASSVSSKKTHAYSSNIPDRKQPSAATSLVKRTSHWYMPMFQLELPNIRDISASSLFLVDNSSSMLPLFQKQSEFSVKESSKARADCNASNAPGKKDIGISQKALQSQSTKPERDLVGNGIENHESDAEAKKIGPLPAQRSEGLSGNQTGSAPGKPAKQSAQQYRALNRPQLVFFRTYYQSLPKGNITTSFRKSSPGLVRKNCFGKVTVGRSKSNRRRVVSKRKLVGIRKRPVLTMESLLAEAKALPVPE